jgi:hypothetical protein
VNGLMFTRESFVLMDSFFLIGTDRFNGPTRSAELSARGIGECLSVTHLCGDSAAFTVAANLIQFR